MPRGEPLSPELVMVAPPDEARRARAALEQEDLLEQASHASEERAEHVRRAWERLAEHQVEQVEHAWEQVAARAVEQVERHREEIAVRAAELAQRELTEFEDVAEPTEAVVEPDERPVWEQLGAPAEEESVLFTEADDVADKEAAAEDVTEEPSADWDAFLARARAAPVEPIAIEHEPDLPPPRKRRGRRSAFIALAALALAVLAGTAWARDWFRDSEPSVSSATPPPVQTPRQPSTPASAPAKPKPKATPKKKTQKSAPSKRKRTTAAPRASKATKKPASFVPARVWSWPAARGSSGYRIRFFRNDRKILDVRTTKPRLVLDKGFKFRNGRYRWTVVPISSNGERLRPIVDSTFVVSGQ